MMYVFDELAAGWISRWLLAMACVCVCGGGGGIAAHGARE
jgi:hypothetical protein